MKVVYYSNPSYMDLSLMFVRELSKLVELHFILEIAPESRKSSLLDITHKVLPDGITDATVSLQDCFPKNIQSYWKNCASFNLLVYHCPKNIHPAAWWTGRKGAKFISNINPDVINIDDISLRRTWFVKMLKKWPVVISVHDPKSHSGEENWRNDLARYLTFPKINKFLLHNSTQIDPFMKHYNLKKDQLCSIPLGTYDIYKEWEEEHKQDDGKTILFFGRISSYKGLDVLFRAAPYIAAKIPGVRIIVAGKPIQGYNIPETPDLAGKGKIEIISEYISNSHLASLFRQATVVVCPYIDATQSGIVLTAYAFNKPVVATNTGGLPEYVKHMQTGLLVKPGHDQELANALIKILCNKDLQIKFESGIKHLASDELCWQNIARQTYSVYQELLK